MTTKKRKSLCKPCEPKNCPMLYGLFIEKDKIGSLGEVMKARLLHYYEVGQKVIQLTTKKRGER
jgi:hypothetical protein